ncbi:MAG: glycosyltransferase family 4 protein, partial [Gemmataceae bacterium]|nr:glycosyltransferase family 4 protein [Gemmataceae bacterium]
MHVAILDEELPYPPNSGKRIRTYNLVKRLAARHRITYVCHQNPQPDEADQAAKHFKALGIEPLIVPRPVPPKHGWRFAARLFGNLFSPLPYSVATHRSRALSQQVRRLAATQEIDLWHCEWTPYAQSVKPLVGVPWVVVAHNVESMIWQRMAENETNPARRWYIQLQHRKFRCFERWAYSHATRCIAVSDQDACQLTTEFGAQQVDVVENGVDIDYFAPSGESRDPHTILFLGSLDWRPNLDAVRLLIERIFPTVQREEPQARLQIVGRKPPEWLRRMADRPGLELHADVADVRPFLGRAGMLAVPLRIGGGSRLKILEALACGTP